MFLYRFSKTLLVRRVVSVGSMAAFLCVASIAGAADLPQGFAETRMATSLNPTTISFAPDGRLFLCEKQGLLRVFDGDHLRVEPLLDITDQVDSWNERGFMSVCFDPEFQYNGWLYVYYTVNRDRSDTTHQSSNNRVSRFTLKDDVVDRASEVVLLEIDNLTKTGWHNGGGLEFGNDGKLYIGTGENAKGPNAQDPSNLLGKLLRIEKDGSIPSDNPHYADFNGKNRAIVAMGLRNPFTIAKQAESGLFYISVVGATYEQIVRYETGGAPEAVNYGWPEIDGPLGREVLPANFKGADYYYDHGQGQGLALCGGDFYNPTQPGPDAFPDRFVGKFFFSDYGGWIKLIDPDHATERLDFATGIDRPIDVAIAPDGALWYIARAGIPGGSNKANTASDNGSIWRVRWTGEVGTSPVAADGIEADVSLDAVSQSDDPRIRPAGGRYTGPVWIQIENSVPDSSIRFTTDGSDPDVNSDLYVKPFELTEGSTVKAITLQGSSIVGKQSKAEITIEGDTSYGLEFRPPLSEVTLPAASGDGLPATLLATGIFVDKDLTPAVGLVPYSLGGTAWADGAEVQRWVGLPDQAQVGFTAEGEYDWPSGTVFVQHFEIVINEQTEARRRLETRLLVLDETGEFGYGANYRWRPDNSDADLVAVSGEEELLKIADASGGSREQAWMYPSRGLCFMCHTPNAGFVLGPKTHQLNGDHLYPKGDTDNQLRTWSYLQMFDHALDENAIDGYLRTTAVDDESASLETRVRSYLDVNCAGCHRPAGTGSEWDARFEIPLENQGILEGIVRNNLGIDGAKIVFPGDAGKSILHARIASNSVVEQMPPLTRKVVDAEAVELLRRWIEERLVETE